MQLSQIISAAKLTFINFRIQTVSCSSEKQRSTALCSASLIRVIFPGSV